MRNRLACLGTLILVPLLLASWPALSASEPHAISKSEVRSGSPSTTHARLKDVIWDLFEQQDLRTKRPPTRRLSHLFLETKTQGTHVPGLCHFDTVEVAFEPLRPNEKGPGAASKAVGLRSTSHFRFLVVPEKDYDDLVQPTLVSAMQCKHVSKRQAFFTAESESEATEGFRVLLRLVDATRKQAKFSLECNFVSTAKALPCAPVVASLKPEDLTEVEDCDPPSSNLLCHKLYLGDRLITVFTRGNIYPGPPPGEIVSAKVDFLITLADRVID